MPTTNRTPTLAEVIRVAFERRLMDVYVSMPGSIQSYNPVNQTATVLPLLRKLGPTPSGTDQVYPLPALQSVPVMFFGSGTWRITVPVSAGDQCLLVWADRGLDRWKGTPPGNYDATHTIDPGSFNLHHLTDAVAILGLVSPAAPRAATANDRMSLGSDGGAVVEILPAEIDLKASTVKLGTGASQSAVLGDLFLADLTTLVAAIATAVGTSGTPAGAAASGAAITSALATFNAVVHASASVKVST